MWRRGQVPGSSGTGRWSGRERLEERPRPIEAGLDLYSRDPKTVQRADANGGDSPFHLMTWPEATPSPQPWSLDMWGL